jgi:ATP-dependent DNA helicase RecG
MNPDFLKELCLPEGRGTGFPTIYNAMVANESPEPSFETDDSTYVLVTLPVHISDGAKDFTFKILTDITLDEEIG